MRRQPLHESNGGSVMTRRPRRRAQISRWYHLLPPPPPPPPLPPPPPSTPPTTLQLGDDQDQIPSHQLFITSQTLQCRFHNASSESREYLGNNTSFKNCLKNSTRYQAFKTSLIGKPLDLSNALTQVGKLPVWKLLLFFLVLSLLSRPAMCKPWMDEQPDKVTFRSRICQPVSASDLRRRMGPAFDEERMAADMASAKHLLGDDAMSSWAKGTDGYQSDGPAAGGGGGLDGDSSSSLVEAEHLLGSEESLLREEGMLYGRGRQRVQEREEVDFDFDFENGRVEEREEIDVGVDVEDESDGEQEKGKALFGRRRWLPRRRIINSHRTADRERSRSGVYKDFSSSNDKDDLGHENNILSDSYKYMRRRRRRRSLQNDDISEDSKSQSKESDRKARKFHSRKSNRKNSPNNSRESSKKYKNLLPLRLSISGKLRNSRKLRKQLKKEFRQQSRKLNKPPPWTCKLYHTTVFMKKDVFPPVLRDGRCGTDKCFYRLYNCEPNKYAIKLLQRDEQHCNPLPIVGNTTIYEERWNIVTRHVTVGCNCASLVSSGKNKNRRKI